MRLGGWNWGGAQRCLTMMTDVTICESASSALTAMAVTLNDPCVRVQASRQACMVVVFSSCNSVLGVPKAASKPRTSGRYLSECEGRVIGLDKASFHSLLTPWV